MPRRLIAGNWKMNGLRASGLDLVRDLAHRVAAQGARPFDMLVCPPAPLLRPIAEAIGDSGLELGAQDCHPERSGAHTGDISAEMLKDAGCAYVIVGHSERRSDHGESDALVRAKAEAARAAGLVPIVCVGETAGQRAAGKTLTVVETQVRGSLPRAGDSSELVLAYEPIWAIGTGRTATQADAGEAHGHIRAILKGELGGAAGAGIRILYGGSVKPANARELLVVANVDGALVGGASLKADDFWAIATSCP